MTPTETDTRSPVERSTPDIAGFCKGYELRRHNHEDKANEGSLRCRADWEAFIGPIERWGSCNPWEGHFGSVVLPFCMPERLALNMDTDNISLDQTQYRTVRSIIGTKQIQSKILLELLSIDAPCAGVVIDSWKTMIATTAKQDKKRVFGDLEEYVDFRIADTGAPFVDMLMRFGVGIRLTPGEQKLIEPIVKPCYAALGLANDYFSFDIEWEEFQAEDDKTTMTNASLRCPRYHPELCEDASSLLRDEIRAVQGQAEAEKKQATRTPTHTPSRERNRSPSHSDSDISDASPTVWSQSDRSSVRSYLAPAEYISSLPSKGVREAFINGLNVWLVLPDHPTHMIFGSEQTINSANFLRIDTMDKVRQLDDPACMDIYLEEMRNLFIGQSFDLYWTRQGECPSEEDITPLLTTLSNTLNTFFQIRDDYKNLTSEYTPQKGFCEDLDECKFSHPLIHALSTQPKNMTMQLRGILQQSRSSGAGGLDVALKEVVLGHLRMAGSLGYTLTKMGELMVGGGRLETEMGGVNWVVRLLIHRLKNHTTTMPPKKVLIILSDANSFPLTKTSGANSGKTISQPSGFFLTELAKPLSRLLRAGHEITFASPSGKEPVPDPNSESLLAFAGNFYERARENDLVEKMKAENGFSKPRTFASISDDELRSFAGVFIPGGHAPLADLGDDPELGRILRFFHKENKPTAAICHGPYALLSTKASGDGEFVYKGYKITSWSDAEEKVMESVLGGEIEKVEGRLREEGAEMVEGVGEKIGKTTLDRELLTGGNPMAAEELGERFVRMISVDI
ncbi:class I glutamine amidotransferase-like protein [Aspergillus crustosus]